MSRVERKLLRASSLARISRVIDMQSKILRGLIDAQQINTRKLNRLLEISEADAISGEQPYFDPNDLKAFLVASRKGKTQ